MNNRIQFPLALVAALVCALLAPVAKSAAAQSTSAPPTTAEVAASDETQQALRSGLHQMQEQVRTIQKAIEDQRQQTEASAKRNEETMTLRFGAIEKSLDDQKKSLEEQRRSLDAQRQREMETSRTMVYVAGGFAVAGLVAILITAWLQMRTVQRLTEVSSSLRLGTGLSFPLALAESMTPGENVVALSKQRYLDEVQRLQRRVHDMEHTEVSVEPPAGNGNARHETKAKDEAAPGTRTAAAGPLSQVAAFLGKGQTFLNLDQTEKALACFDEALALEPDHVDGLIKRGAALERLQRFDEAISAYDRIIGLDGRQTTAYLLKGGVFNRMKRFNDALACYDQALKTQTLAKTS